MTQENVTTVWFKDKQVDLLSLPVGSIISDVDGDVWQKGENEWWLSPVYDYDLSDLGVVDLHGKYPVTILRVGF